MHHILKQTLCSGDVRAVEGVGDTLSVGQVVWAPSTEGHQYLVFVGWLASDRKLGMKYCYNRPCFLHAVKAPSFKSEDSLTRYNNLLVNILFCVAQFTILLAIRNTSHLPGLLFV